MTVVLASAAPAALRRVAVIGGDAGSDVRRAGHRLSAALAGARTTPVWSRGLGDDVVAFAASWAALDEWVARVAQAFERADAGRIGPPSPTRVVPEAALGVVAEGPWVDSLSDGEAEAAALRIAATLRPVADRLTGERRAELRARLWPLVARLRERWPAAVISAPSSSSSACAPPPPRRPDGLEEAIGLLRLAGPGRVPHTAGVAEAFGDGFFGGELSSSYDNLGGEVARTAGHVASGVLVFGDVRDALVEGSRDNWLGVALAVGGVVPGAGDALKGAKAVDDLAGTRRVAIDLAAEEGRGGHALSEHVGRSLTDLRARVVDNPRISASSAFRDRATAESAVAEALRANPEYVARITELGRAKTVFRHDAGVALGDVVPPVGPPASTTILEVVLKPDPMTGFRVHSAYPVRGR